MSPLFRATPRSSLRAPARGDRFGRWILALPLLVVLLVEVWQSSKLAELSLRQGEARQSLADARARLEFLRAARERRTTRAELAPVAARLGLRPAEGAQVVLLPAAYLAPEDEDGRGRGASDLFAATERIARALVPDARARGR